MPPAMCKIHGKYWQKFFKSLPTMVRWWGEFWFQEPIRTSVLSFWEYITFKKVKLGRRRTNNQWLIYCRKIQSCKLSLQGGRNFVNLVLMPTMMLWVREGVSNHYVRTYRRRGGWGLSKCKRKETGRGRVMTLQTLAESFF